MTSGESQEEHSLSDSELESLEATAVSEFKELTKDIAKSGGISADEAMKVTEAIERGAIEVKAKRKVAKKEEEESEGDIRAQLRDMGIPGKVKLAMFGSATCRQLLVMDANRMVQEAVLKNPQIQEREIIDYCKNANLPENVIRKISDSKSWMKSYLAKLNIVNNPKAPPDIAMKWIKFLRVSDLKKVASSKNISQIISTAAKKRVADVQKRK